MQEKDRRWWKSFDRGLAEQSRHIKISPPPEVDQPTYKVVGEIERVDQRDTIQSRMTIKDPNSPEYQDDYGRHPEFKEVDNKNQLASRSLAQRQSTSMPCSKAGSFG